MRAAHRESAESAASPRRARTESRSATWLRADKGGLPLPLDGDGRSEPEHRGLDHARDCYGNALAGSLLSTLSWELA